ncbi:Col-cuticle-N domain-containing protein [Aphelenchoides fujianensis]|nr:Col-cuticle-N domain-containing protein [Aphelenchoides fujianensis]
MVYSYVSHVRNQMHTEMVFCKGSAQDIWKEVHHLKTIPVANNRTARQSGYDQGVEEAPQAGSCDGCCIPGPPGPSGAPGRPGKPGKPGAPGRVRLVRAACQALSESPELPPSRRRSSPANPDRREIKDRKLNNPAPMDSPDSPARKDCPVPMDLPAKTARPAVRSYFPHDSNLILRLLSAQGPQGPPGNAGEKGICPKYCAIDGGVFFEDGTRR